MQTSARCLQMMLQVERFRDVFVSMDGITAILAVLSSRVNFQIQYQLCFCLWIITFNEELATKMNKYNMIPILADIMSEAVKEKVTRMILATFRVSDRYRICVPLYAIGCDDQTNKLTDRWSSLLI